jgi:GNAT superfamily N-acetyltransferase
MRLCDDEVPPRPDRRLVSRPCERFRVDSEAEMPGYTIRRSTVGDAAVIAHHRVGMFRDMGQIPTEALAIQLRDASAAALADCLNDGSYAGWLAVDGDDQVLAGAGIHIKPQLPRIAPDGTRLETAPIPLVVNVYTEPRWRKQGIARALMRAMMEWATAEGFDRVFLHASDAGRPLYVSIGFAPTNEMCWIPRPDNEPGRLTE